MKEEEGKVIFNDVFKKVTQAKEEEGKEEHMFETYVHTTLGLYLETEEFSHEIQALAPLMDKFKTRLLKLEPFVSIAKKGEDIARRLDSGEEVDEKEVSDYLSNFQEMWGGFLDGWVEQSQSLALINHHTIRLAMMAKHNNNDELCNVYIDNIHNVVRYSHASAMNAFMTYTTVLIESLKVKE